ncbi:MULTISPECIES: type II toxin-antitoxin system ParD family antitoxin [Thalassospira]|uniref:type II toxin-antitoxin system ParD family antitoxin n=1 Tax=Thalassospira TaxID=168934 RepID=UPI000C51033B|nr:MULTISPECIES: type II toxin-antitoxin system ParD family antitoxin [Thalassospira]MAL42362.1 type II toxin-antitoxin system ParD family antitoxin [Thalassospira sp.]MCC4241592.1 type II toxin-antitoxin system ParD family antitoxin [Thalassospira povalilytica]|tara:strand:+ start:229 stop:468 length:240 start_codon:yes stop_codon:yes gene_type:complete
MIKKSITVTETQEAWIQAQLATGQYASDSEVVREALREKQMRMAEMEHIRSTLIAAEESGLSTLSKEDIRTSVKAELEP